MGGQEVGRAIMAGEKSEASDTAYRFHLQEHSLLRNEILEIVRDIRTMQRALAAGLGLYFAWFFSNAEDLRAIILTVAVWLPFLVCVLFRVNMGKRVEALRTTAQYLQRVESRYADPELEGWENHLVETRRDDCEANMALPWDQRFCTFLGLVTCGIALIVTVAELRPEWIDLW